MLQVKELFPKVEILGKFALEDRFPAKRRFLVFFKFSLSRYHRCKWDKLDGMSKVACPHSLSPLARGGHFVAGEIRFGRTISRQDFPPSDFLAFLKFSLSRYQRGKWDKLDGTSKVACPILCLPLLMAVILLEER